MKTSVSTLFVALSLAVVAIASHVLAQTRGATLNLTTDARWGQHLVNDEGRSIYLYVLDEAGASSCVDACTNNWPPLTGEVGSEPTVGEGLDAALVGTIERADGTLQVTYAGHPLYTFRRDTEAGHTRGQRLGDQFFLVSPTGEAINEEVAAEVTTLPEEEMEAVMQAGHLTFNTYCAACHGSAGQGGVGPRFAGNSALADKNYVMTMILDGFIDHGMPAWGDVLSDEQIAGVASYIRNSWGNDFGAVLAEEVAAKR